MKEQLKKEFTNVKGDTAQLMGDLASVVFTLIDIVKTETGEKKEKLTKDLEDKVFQLRRGVEIAKERSAETKQQIEKNVSEHPWTSVASAFGVGLLVGGLLLRKK
ncbi:MAG: DUF883 family protein [Bdellovibrionales bacterium]|nr:DUF883 family protein [Bdellovibrionales bacterium]